MKNNLFKDKYILIIIKKFYQDIKDIETLNILFAASSLNLDIKCVWIEEGIENFYYQNNFNKILSLQFFEIKNLSTLNQKFTNTEQIDSDYLNILIHKAQQVLIC